MIIRPVRNGDNRFSARGWVNYQAGARSDARAKSYRFAVRELCVKLSQLYPQDLSRYPARVLNRFEKSSWMRGSTSRNSLMRLQACITVV